MSATFKQKLLAYPFYLLPHHAISWCMFKIARIEWKPFKNLAIRIYTKLNTVNMDDAVITDKYAYKSLNAFFTRAIKPERRPLDSDPANWACPVDGAVSQAGKIDGDRIFQAKGHDFSLLELLGGDQIGASQCRRIASRRVDEGHAPTTPPTRLAGKQQAMRQGHPTNVSPEAAVTSADLRSSAAGDGATFEVDAETGARQVGPVRDVPDQLRVDGAQSLAVGDA